MKKTTLLKTIILLLTLTTGSTSVWADVIESNFTDKYCAVGTGELQWTGTNIKQFESSGDARGVQSEKNQTAMVFTSNPTQTATLGTITKVVVKASANGARSITVTVGGESFDSTQDVASGTKNSDFTFTGSASGTIVVSFNGGTNNSSCWIKKITVTYSASGDPSISAEDIELEGSDTSGEISYSIANAVDGASVVPTCDDEWISNFSVNEGTKKVTFDVEENTGAPREGTVTLTYKKGEDVYDAVDVKVTQGGIVNYTLAKAVVPGRHYIITNGTNGAIKAMGSQASNNRTAVDIVATSGEASVSTSAGVYEFVIAGDMATGYYTIYDVENTKYLYAASSSSNHLKIQSDIDANSRWTIEINGETGVATIKAKDSSNRNWMRNNGTIFSCYTSGQSDIYLFERDGDTSVQNVDVTINAACNDGEGNYYGTYSNEFAFVVPEGLTVSEIGIVDGKLNVEDYAEGDIVPANTGVMISAASAGEKTLTLAVGGTSKLDTGNCLKASGGAGIDADAMATAAPSCNYYRLTMHNPDTENKIGFWWGAAGGAAFDIAANKAYLAVPSSGAGARDFVWFDEGETTPINEVRSLKPDVRGEYFNLNGQRIAQPTKGLYIINGKKVVIK